MRILLVVYDNHSLISVFPQGIAYIASALLKAGHDVKIYNQDMHHYPDEHLTQYLDENKYDILGISIIGGYWQFAKLFSLSKAIKASKQRPFFIVGGHLAAPDPEYFLKKTNVDCIVCGEGLVTIVELLDALQHGNLHDVKGIAFIEKIISGGKVIEEKFVQTEEREQIKDVETIARPAYELFPMEYYRLLRYANVEPTDFVMTVLSSFGCYFSCNFCFRMIKGFRPRKAESILNEIAFLQDRWRINVIDFSDELLMSSKVRTLELCEAFINSGLKFRWHCNGRLNFASKEVLQRMKEAGCIFINYGIEAMDDKVLERMHKHLTVKQIIAGVENTLEVGISPGLNIIWGHIGDTKETLQKNVEFLLKYDDGAQLRTLRPVTCYPGSELYYDAIKMGLLKDIEDFYQKHINSDLLAVNFTEYSDEEFHKMLCDANSVLLRNYYMKKLRGSINQCKKLYLEHDTSFRGWRVF